MMNKKDQTKAFNLVVDKKRADVLNASIQALIMVLKQNPKAVSDLRDAGIGKADIMEVVEEIDEKMINMGWKTADDFINPE